MDLLGVASANDGRGDGRAVERPGDGDDSGADAAARADGFEEVGDRKVAGEQRLLVVLRVAAEVVLGEGGDSLFGHGAGEQAGVHWSVVNDSDAVLLAEGEDLGLDGSVDHGVGGLEGGDGGDFEGALHLGDTEVGDADPADLAFALEVGHGRPCLFDLFVGYGPMDLIEIDGVDLKAAQACFRLFTDLLQGAGDLAFVVPDRTALCEDVGLL